MLGWEGAVRGRRWRGEGYVIGDMRQEWKVGKGGGRQTRTTMPFPIVGTSSPIQFLLVRGSEPGPTIWMESATSVGSPASGMEFW